MILIPLKPMVINGNVDIPIDVLLDPMKNYELAIYSLVCCDIIPYGIHTIHCNLLNPSIFNPDQILYRFTDQLGEKTIEYYKMDTYNLRTLSLRLTTLPSASLAITLAIREYEE